MPKVWFGAKSFGLCSEVFGAAVQITQLGDHPLAAGSTAVKAVFSVSHFHQLLTVAAKTK